MEALWNLEIGITLFLQHLGSWLALPMKAFSLLGQEEFFLVIVPAIYWCFDAVIGMRVGIMLMVSSNLFGFFKLVFHSPRPYWISNQVRPYLSESSFGFPSGHAQNAASIWGIFAASMKKNWITTGAIAVIFLIGLSRIYLGVHFTSDVLFGWLVGALLVLIFAKFERPVLAWFRRLKLGSQIGALFIVSLFMILINFIALYFLNGWTMPQDWLANATAAFPDLAINPLDPSSAFTTAGTFFGMTAGVAWLFRYRPGFQFSGGNAGTRVLRYFIGVLGMFIIYYGLGKLFPRELDVVSYSLRYLRYALLGCYVSALAPILFGRLGLAGSNPKMIPVSVEPK